MTSVSRSLVLCEFVADMADRRGPHRDAHLAYLGGLHADGVLEAAGPLGDPVSGSALVFAVDPARADALVREDPYVRAGLVTGWTVEPWSVVVGGPGAG